MWVRRPKYPLLSLLTLSLPRCHLKTTHNSEQFETRKPFWHWHVKGSPSKRIALKINVIGLENMLLCIIQPGNVTGWDSEGVKWPIYIQTSSSAVARSRFSSSTRPRSFFTSVSYWSARRFVCSSSVTRSPSDLRTLLWAWRSSVSSWKWKW